MKNLLKYALLAIVVFGFVGCGNQYAITYNTNPIGANIVCGGVGKGLSPLTLYYDRDGINDEGFLYTTPCKAVFSSGYKKSFSTKWDTNQFPYGVQQTLTRPQGKGYKQDMTFVLEYQKTLIMQQQAEAAQKAAKKASPPQQQYLQNKSTICNTFGNITMCN